MIGLLGDIVLENIEVTGIESDYGAEYSEHARINLKPLLQAQGETLAEIRLTFELHIETGDPVARLKVLQDLCSKQRAAPLVIGGQYRGYFVLPMLSVIEKWLDGDGNILYQSVSITLKEYAGKIDKPKSAPAVHTGNDPVGSQSVATADLSTAQHASLKSAVASSKQSLELLNAQIDAVALMQSLSDHNAITTSLATAQSNFATLLDVVWLGAYRMQAVAGFYPDKQLSFVQSAQAVDVIKIARDALKSPFDLATLPDRIVMAKGQMNTASELITAAAQPLVPLVAQMTVRAWL